MTYSHMGTPTLPSAQLRFTSEFGMGSGGATMLWSPDKIVYMDVLMSRSHGWLGVTLHVLTYSESYNIKPVSSILFNA